jgi:hypothetical protein
MGVLVEVLVVDQQAIHSFRIQRESQELLQKRLAMI